MKISLVAAAALFLLCACNDSEENQGNSNSPTQAEIPAAINYSVLNVYPHDSTAFTQGLIFHNGKLYEGTGAPDNYRSSLRITDPVTGKVETKIDQGNAFFGEGITILNNKLYQLTWQNRKIFVYDLATLKKTGEFDWGGEGWGITHNGSKLIISDGLTNNLYITNPETLKVEEVVSVNDENGPVSNINELEYIDGYVYANKWETNYILKIDLDKGKVVGRADLSGLLEHNTRENTQLPKYQNGSAVLNGIAYDSASKKIFVTGKLWPNMFEIQFR